jgi:hypothetical protein
VHAAKASRLLCSGMEFLCKLQRAGQCCPKEADPPEVQLSVFHCFHLFLESSEGFFSELLKHRCELFSHARFTPCCSLACYVDPLLLRFPVSECSLHCVRQILCFCQFFPTFVRVIKIENLEHQNKKVVLVISFAVDVDVLLDLKPGSRFKSVKLSY